MISKLAVFREKPDFFFVDSVNWGRAIDPKPVFKRGDVDETIFS